MSTFAQQFLFLRNPHGGVEDLDRMKAAGFQGIFCNVRDYPVSEWEQIIQPRALAAGMFCGPWGRTAKGLGDSQWAPEVLTLLVDTAERWDSPLIANCESEIDHSGDDITTVLADTLKGYDAAISTLGLPMNDVSWVPVANIPILPQVGKDGIVPASQADLVTWRDLWWAYGINCVWWTLGTYGGSKPTDYALQAPYSLYTADDCGGNYAAWSARSSGYVGCNGNGGDDMTQIGDQDGIVAAVNRLRDLDPGGTLLIKTGGKWPDISTLPTDLSKWKAYDKLQRTMQILKDDHDAAGT